MSFSNSKQSTNPKNSNTSDRPPKVKRDEHISYSENTTTFVKKAPKNKEEDYYGKSSNNIENSQNNQKPAKTKQHRATQEEGSNHQESSHKANKRGQNNNRQTYVPKGNQEQVQHSKETGLDQEGDYIQENRSQHRSKKQGKGRKAKNQDDVVYYVKKSQNESQQINDEEQKEVKGTSHKKQEDLDKQENREEAAQKVETIVEKKEETDTNNNKVQALTNHILSQLKLNQPLETEGIRRPESGVKSSELLRNEQDRVSQAASKPVIEVSIASETQSVTENPQSLQDDKDVISVCSGTETSYSRQASSIPHYPQPQIMSPIINYPQMPASADQQRIVFASGFPQIPMFHAPFVVFPQPNGTSFIQTLYQMPGMNVVPRRAEEDQERYNQQPMYLIPSAMLPTTPIAENQMNNENMQTTERMAGQFFPGYAMNPHFMPYAQIHPGFLANTLIANPVMGQQVYANANVSASDKETHKVSLTDSQVKDDSASDRRDD